MSAADHSSVSVEPIPDQEVEKYVYRHGEGCREIIVEALARATTFPHYNPATFNFDRYVAAVIFEASFAGSTRGPCAKA